MFKKKIYDGMGLTNSVLSRACYGLSRCCVNLNAPIMATRLFNAGNNCATKMLKYWIKSMDCEDNLDVRAVTN